MINIKSLNNNSVESPSNELALSVLEGLSSTPKNLPSRLFYDDKGSELFKKIMDLEEYYPTNCEDEILRSHSEKITKSLGNEQFNLIELGCGDGAKTIVLLNEFLKGESKFKYFPLDISKAAIEFLVNNLEKEYQEIPFPVEGVVAEYFEGLKWISENIDNRNMVMFLGGNIGNMNRATAMRFLRHLWYSLNDGDYVLIGFDLRKDLDVLYNAYNDSKGVTKEFNFNVLDRINKTLGANFNRSNFQHQGLYNLQTGAMESYLISLVDQTVHVEDLGKEFKFKPWEPIHMEYSYKYLMSDIIELAESTGFSIVDNFTDKKDYFMDSMWKVVKN